MKTVLVVSSPLTVDGHVAMIHSHLKGVEVSSYSVYHPFRYVVPEPLLRSQLDIVSTKGWDMHKYVRTH